MFTVKKTPAYSAFGREPVYTITVDQEGAEYLKTLAEDELIRTSDAGVNRGRGDAGARDIVDHLNAALAED